MCGTINRITALILVFRQDVPKTHCQVPVRHTQLYPVIASLVSVYVGKCSTGWGENESGMQRDVSALSMKYKL